VKGLKRLLRVLAWRVCSIQSTEHLANMNGLSSYTTTSQQVRAKKRGKRKV
jgi:hypothetical protein